VNALWLDDLEAFEAITQDDETRRLFLRMAQLAQHGRLEPFLQELDADADLDPATKSMLSELAHDSTFLHAVEDYVLRTREQH
jgi:hypothetical protein